MGLATIRFNARRRRIFLIAAAIGIAALDLWLLLPAKAAEPPITVTIWFPLRDPERPLPQSLPNQSAVPGFQVPDEGDEDLPPRGEVADASRVLADDVATLGVNATYGRALQAMRIFAENGNCLFGIMRNPDSDNVTPRIAWMELEWVRSAKGTPVVCRGDKESHLLLIQVTD